MVLRTALIVSLIAIGCGKKDASDLASTDTPDPNEPYTAVEGTEATKFLASGYDVAAQDPDAVSKALTLAEDAEAEAEEGEEHYFEGDSATLNFLKSGEKEKLAIDTAAFELPKADTLGSTAAERSIPDGFSLADPPLSTDPATFDPKKDTVKLDATSWANKAEFKISRLTNIPVKQQGERGTCAAHTGVSYLEYMALKKHTSRLTTLDLSEQRFYMMSKKELWDTGGGVVGQDGGSSWYNGYSLSMGKDGTTAPSQKPEFNIPLESDCGYVATNGKNELQIAQKASCKHGSVKVTSLSETWYYIKAGNKKEWHSNALLKAQDIFNYLKDKDLPVPVAAELTDGWMKNDGMITFAKSKNQPKQGGHAFLVVGARKLDEKKYPNEGGMCFIIKNSWGTGWGAAGYSCMTLAWFNNFRRAEFYDIAFDVNVDLDYVAPLKSTAVPKATPKAKLVELEAGDEGVPVEQPVDIPTNPGDEQQAEADTATPAPAEPAGTTEDGFTVGGLVDATGNVVKAFYTIDGANIELVGILQGETGVTQGLTLGYDAGSGKLTYTHATHGVKTVGELKDGKITLCSQQYVDVCALNYVEADKRLVLGLTEAEFRNYPADPNASYTSLVSYSGYAIEFALAGNDFADFRLEIAGTPTNPIRLRVDALSGAITYKGKEVGDYQKLGLCSGDYKNVCRMVVNSEDKTLNILFKMQ